MIDKKTALEIKVGSYTKKYTNVELNEIFKKNGMYDLDLYEKKLTIIPTKFIGELVKYSACTFVSGFREGFEAGYKKGFEEGYIFENEKEKKKNDIQ